MAEKMKENRSLPASENKLNYLRDKMNELSVSNPRNNVYTKQFAISTNEFANLIECNFYVSDESRNRGVAFGAAFEAAKQSDNSIEFCVYVASMICDVSPEFRSSVETALKGIGVRTVEVKLPSEADKLDDIVIDVMDLPVVLVYFGCCILLLFKETSEITYKTFMSSCISELWHKVACLSDDDDDLNNPPFDFKKANAITNLLGGCSKLREDAIGFIVSNMDSEDTAIRGVCKYLWDTLSWSGINHIILMNDFLVKPQSPFLLDPHVSKEVDNLMEACDAVASHTHPQFYIYLASDLELLKVDPSRFPTLIARAEEVKMEGDKEQSSDCGGRLTSNA